MLKRYYGEDGVQRQDYVACELLVLWQGYPMEDAKWISASYFSDEDALQENIQANQIPEEQYTQYSFWGQKVLLGRSNCGKSDSVLLGLP